MQKALNMMLKEVREVQNQRAEAFGQTAQQIKIEKTDLYVRFLPKDSAELELIQEDTLLQLYDYPLDHEIEQEGDVYHDPDLPKDQITWQYTVVKPDYKFPDIRYEILSELFIPQNSKGYTVIENDEGDMQVY